jgi:hypothetical protein
MRAFNYSKLKKVVIFVHKRSNWFSLLSGETLSPKPSPQLNVSNIFVTLDLLTFFCLAKKKVTKKRRDQNMLPYALAEASPHFGQPTRYSTPYS